MNQEHLANLCGLNGADGQRNKPSPDRSPSRLTLGQFSEPRLLIPRLLSDCQDGAIRELAKRLEATSRINHVPAFLEAVLNREAEFPTFIKGVGCPSCPGRGGTTTLLRRRPLSARHSVGPRQKPYRPCRVPLCCPAPGSADLCLAAVRPVRPHSRRAGVYGIAAGLPAGTNAQNLERSPCRSLRLQHRKPRYRSG